MSQVSYDRASIEDSFGRPMSDTEWAQFVRDMEHYVMHWCVNISGVNNQEATEECSVGYKEYDQSDYYREPAGLDPSDDYKEY